MNVTITGGTGFVGRNLTKALNKNEGIKLNYLNVREEINEIVTPSDAIIHLAGKAHDLSNASNIEDYFTINYGITQKLYDLFLKSNIKDFIFISSVKAVADNVSSILFENAIPDPKTPYGQSKLKAEQYLLGKSLPDGKRVFILRPCMIHGPGNKGNLNLLYKFVEKGYPYPLGAFNNQRSYLSIQNLIYVIEAILNNSKIKGGVYNVSDDEALSTNDVIEIIANVSEIKPRIWKIPRNLIKGLAKIGDLVNLPLNSNKLKKLTDNYVVNNDKLKTELGIKEYPMTSREGLTITIKSFN